MFSAPCVEVQGDYLTRAKEMEVVRAAEMRRGRGGVEARGDERCGEM